MLNTRGSPVVINPPATVTTSTPLMSFSTKYQNYQWKQQQIKAVTAPDPVITSSQTPTKKMKWGEPTWLLMHTLAQKVKESAFPIIRLELLNLIKNICANLPCPDCANHATQYMAAVNFNTIQTKQHLIDMLFRFHNTVNKKKGFDLFTHEELEPKYGSAITVNIITNFLNAFQQKNYSIRMIANDFHRARAVSVIRAWLQQNFQAFDP